ncbi:MAG: serine hydrolase [Phycisphaerales bacterium]
MTNRISFFLTLLICNSCSASHSANPAPRNLDSPKDRQAAVEKNLLAETWVDGHAFGLEERMRILDVPGVSVAVIHNGQLDWAAGYGVRDETSGLPVNTETLFQAASISKPVSALAAIQLAQEGRLDLDAPIQKYLVSYQLPASDFHGEVTPRRILNHTGGLNVSGFAGYQPGEYIPTAPDLLEGKGNSDPLQQTEHAGARYRYSGGGSTLLQVAMSDITKQDFNSIMQEIVLHPLNMTRSTYEQPLSMESWPNHSAAHDHAGRRVSGGFHVYPEQFPAGLWTTPTDLAKFVLEVQQVAIGQNGKILTPKWGKEMLTPVFGRPALGLFIREFDGEQWFEHSGSNQGFKCDFRASFKGGNGVIIMTNSQTGYGLCQDIIRAVAKVYQWPDMIHEPLKEKPISTDQLKQYVGDYAYSPDEVAFINIEDDRLMVQQLPYPQMPLAPLGNHRFQIIGTEFHIDFVTRNTEKPESLSMSFAPEQHAKRMTTKESWPVQDLVLGNADKAVSRYRKIYETDPQSPLVNCDRLVQLSNSILKFNQPDVAQRLSKCISELYPQKAVAWDALGQAYYMRGEIDEATKAYQECLLRIPEDTSLDEPARNHLHSHTLARLRGLENQSP